MSIVKASKLCETSCSASQSVIIAVKCVHPLHLLTTDSNLRVDVDSDPSLVGTNASFTCPSGTLLIGPTKANCMGNGHWETGPKGD